MCCDYGFRAGAGRLYQEDYGEVPDNVLVLVSGAGRCWQAGGGGGGTGPRRQTRLGHTCQWLAGGSAGGRPRQGWRLQCTPWLAVGWHSLPTAGPATPQAGRALGGAFVKGFSSLDSTLEANKLLPELKAPVKANMSDECRQVGRAGRGGRAGGRAGGSRRWAAWAIPGCPPCGLGLRHTVLQLSCARPLLPPAGQAPPAAPARPAHPVSSRRRARRVVCVGRCWCRRSARSCFS